MNHVTQFKTNSLLQSSLDAALKLWLSMLSPATSYCYRLRVKKMKEMGFITSPTVDHFNTIPHEIIIDAMKKIPHLKESTRQTYAACYISFTRYLARATQGVVRRAYPLIGSGSMSTFYNIYEKCESRALTLGEWHRFIDELEKKSKRDALIAKCMLHGAKRISEVLGVRRYDIDWQDNTITFRQSKTGGQVKRIPITFPDSFMRDLLGYVENTQALGSDYLFVTRNGKPLLRCFINDSFKRVAKKVGISHVHPHMLRATWVTMAKENNITVDEIMKVTGHTSIKTVEAYDKRSIKENVSKRFVLI